MANCPNCGAAISEGEAFCSNCGAPVAAVSQATAANAQTGYQQNYQQNYQQSQQPNFQNSPQPDYYRQPVYQPAGYPQAETPIGIGDWFITILLLAIPIVNIVMLFIWGFGSSAPKSKSNFARAQLIWMAIGIVLSILLTALFGAALTAIFSSGYGF